MVTVKDFKSIINGDGEEFFALIVEGGVQPVRSNKTNRLYFTTRRATVPCTFDRAVCEQVIGTRFQGDVQKVECEPYEFTIKETGETIELSHRWEFTDEDVQEFTQHLVEKTQKIL